MKETIGSNAFRIEYQPAVLDKEIKEDVVSYLWEYRFCGQKYNYTLNFSNGQICDCHRSEPMGIKAKRAIEDRGKRGLSTKREEAEALGIKRLEEQLELSENDSSIIWVSPPGEKEEGYGNYGFVYFGKVKKEKEEKTIGMTAIRVENPSIGGFNSFFNETLDRNVGFKNAEDFLSSPVVISEEISQESIENTLTKIFLYQEKIKAFYALENYSIALKKEHEEGFEKIIYLKRAESVDIKQLMLVHGHKPPVINGSCGSTASIESNNIFNINSSIDSLESDKYGARSFTCPNCKMVNIRPQNELISCCQYCGSNEVSCSHA